MDSQIKRNFRKQGKDPKPQQILSCTVRMTESFRRHKGKQDKRDPSDRSSRIINTLRRIDINSLRRTPLYVYRKDHGKKMIDKH